jgi:microcystin-dependent protein
MADQFVAEIRMFGCNFAPTGWALCNGQLLPISQNTALFSLLGTFYGGNGQSTFALPNLQDSSPLFWGQSPGLSLYDLGQIGGSETVTLLESEIPAHNHNLMGKPAGGQETAAGKLFGVAGTQLPPPNYYATALGTATAMSPTALSIAGSSSPHNNLMPYLCITFCIAMQGVFPARN